jgi:hypothetical protein
MITKMLRKSSKKNLKNMLQNTLKQNLTLQKLVLHYWIQFIKSVNLMETKKLINTFKYHKKIQK